MLLGPSRPQNMASLLCANLYIVYVRSYRAPTDRARRLDSTLNVHSEPSVLLVNERASIRDGSHSNLEFGY
jgi:hypothetical protein